MQCFCHQDFRRTLTIQQDEQVSIKESKNVSEWLAGRGLTVEPYHGSLDPDARLAAEDRLQNNEIKALVATTALGMGYDKPDLGFVVHFQSPGSPVAYYQQVGRAGRALDRSVGGSSFRALGGNRLHGIEAATAALENATGLLPFLEEGLHVTGQVLDARQIA